MRINGRTMLALAGAAVALVGTGGLQARPAVAQTPFAMGTTTVVDPIRGVGEPDIAVLNTNSPFISGPAGSSTQTSFFWNSRDGGQSFMLRGPHNGHWICPALGGGDSLNVVDRKTNDTYVIDQESLLDLGLGKIDGTTGAVNAKCLNSPGVTADRPFLAVANGATSPQVAADGGKAITYLSWQCNGCGGLTTNSLEQLPTDAQNQATPGSGIAFGWTDDGVTYHPAEPGVVATGTPVDPITDSPQESSAIFSYNWHGNMVADPVTGDVFTAISCSGGSCPNFATDNEFGVAVGIPPAADKISSGNVGQFDKLYYQTAASKQADGKAIPSPGSLFPVIAMDSARTLYEAWIQGNGSSSGGTIDPTDWHLYYVSSTCDAADSCTHTKWSKPIQVDHGAQTQASAFGWMTAGDKGKLGFVWLGTSTREHPSLKNPDKQWFPFTAITTDGDTATPHFEQTRLGVYPNHLNDICLHGTTCAVPDTAQKTLGNRNMADFISADVGPDGALQVTYANDANNIATLPSTLLPGLPVTMYARQISGPRLVGSGNVVAAHVPAAKVAAATGDATGDALYPVDPAGPNVPQLDLTGASVGWDGSKLTVHIGVKDLGSTTSPDPSDQVNTWWLAVWKFQTHLYFAKVQANSGGAPTFLAGTPSSYDRPGICMCSSPTLVDYSGGTAVTGAKTADGWDITVPAATVGNPTTGSTLESFAAYSMLDNGKPLIVAPLPQISNMPTIVDATAAVNAPLSQASNGGGNGSGNGNGVNAAATIGTPNTSAAHSSTAAAAGLAVALLTAVALGARRRVRRTGRE
jgi:hypothetical protein